jgi:hypothetical protein
MSEGLADKSFLSVKRGLIDCVTAAWAKEEEFRQARKKETGREPAPCSGGNTLLVLREQDAIQLWMITTNKETAHPNPQQVYDCIPVGDNTAAVFFLNHYWAKIPKTIDCLVTLAVHTVLMAKSEFVDGLEVGVFTHSRFGLLSDDELHSAIEMSKELDSYTARKLGIPGL